MKSTHVSFGLVALWLIALSCSAETLKDLLVANQIPLTSLPRAELAQTVQGSVKSDDRRVVLGYRKLKNNLFVGPIRLLGYDKRNGTVVRSDPHVGDESICDGSLEEPYLFDHFSIVATSINPSAECLLVLDKHLRLSQTLYGFAPVEIAPGMVVIIENMTHFAPVHSERLQLADLPGRTTSELYPPKGDALRAQLANEHARHLPPEETCMRMNDPCDANTFDEDIRSLATDGKGRFAFIGFQSADHPTEEGQPSETAVSQTVLYVYRREKGSWHYCESKIDDSKAEALDETLKSNFNKAASGCTPDLLVIPDMSTADYNPFLKH